MNRFNLTINYMNCTLYLFKRSFRRSVKSALAVSVLIVMSLMLANAVNAHAIETPLQQRQVTGIVTDDSNSPLPGVNVVIKGSTTGTVTDMNGEYTIAVPDGNTVLVFSFIGYMTQEVPVGMQSNVNVQLATDVQTLSEVVVVGYGTQKKSDLTGSVGQVSSEEVLQRPVTNVLQGLQGRVAGVNVFLNSG